MGAPVSNDSLIKKCIRLVPGALDLAADRS